MTLLISLFINKLLQNHDLRYCIAWIILIVKDAQLSENIFFTPENSLSDSDDMTGIEKISMAIRKSKKCGFFGLDPSTNQWLCWFF